MHPHTHIQHTHIRHPHIRTLIQHTHTTSKTHTQGAHSQGGPRVCGNMEQCHVDTKQRCTRSSESSTTATKTHVFSTVRRFFRDGVWYYCSLCAVCMCASVCCSCNYHVVIVCIFGRETVFLCHIPYSRCCVMIPMMMTPCTRKHARAPNTPQ